MLGMWVLIWTCGEQLKDFRSELTGLYLPFGRLTLDTIRTLDWREARVVGRTKAGEIVAIKVREDGGLDQEDSSGGGGKCINQQDLMFRLRM